MLIAKREIFILFTYCLIGLNVTVIAKGFIWVELTNNGPAVLDSSLNFSATVKGKNLEKYYIYKFHHNVFTQSPKEIKSGVNCTYKLSVPKSTCKEGNFTMIVSIFHVENTSKELASTNTSFNLTEGLNGHITVIKDGSIKPGKYFPTGEIINFTLHIHDPNDFLHNASLWYMWRIGDRPQSYNSTLQYNFTEIGEMKVSLTVVAYFPQPSSLKHKWGIFYKNIIIRDEVLRINISGDTWIPHGKMLNLIATCNGSSPFYYCWEIYPGDKPQANFSCDYPLMSPLCHFPVHYYIAVTGQYYFSIFVKNDVSSQRKSMDVRVYDTSRVPQLSVTIIPITCMVIVIIIVIVGVAYFLHQRKRYIIEVADFDFTQLDELVERTFFGRVYDAVKNFLTHGRQIQEQNSTANVRTTARYGTVTECKRTFLDNSTPRIC